MTEADPASLTLLLSHRLDGETRDALIDRFPSIRTVVLPEDGTVPEDARDARVLYRAGMPHDALRTAVGQLPDLAWIHTASAGFNWVLIPEVVARPIHLTRTARVLDVPIAEYVVGTTLALLKRLPTFLRAQADARWERHTDLRGLRGATVVIVGAGAIGTAAAERFRPFGARVVGIKRSPEPLEAFDEVHPPSALRDLMPGADVVVVACPLTPETRGLVDASALALLPPHAVLVNVGRGEVIDEDALVDALRTKRLAGAALDVFATEPLPERSPLWGLENVILTPHVSYADESNTRAAFDEFADNLERFLAGQPLLHEITSRELGY